MKNKETLCVQAGYTPDNGEERVPSIVLSTTYAYNSPEELAGIFDLTTPGYMYNRISNPTCTCLEEKITALEGGVGALSLASGMSAVNVAVLALCNAGDNFLAPSALYGGTYNLFAVTHKRQGIECRFYDLDATESDIEKLVDEKTKVIFVETIANPAGVVADFEKLSKIAKKHKIVFMVDNTIASPYLCRPIEFGANVVVHSSSKYLDGHAIALGGLIIDAGNFEYLGNKRYPDFNKPDNSYHGLVFGKDFGRQGYITRARMVVNRDIGAVMSPMTAFLTFNGMTTLHLRMEKHSQNTIALAKAMEKHPLVKWIKYAGLESDKDYKKAQKYLYKGYVAGMLSFGIKGGREAAVKFQKALKLIRIAVHIADARSCTLHPASTTHRQLSDEALIAAGVAPEMIRLSVGIEAEQDIINDVLQALEASQK